MNEDSAVSVARDGEGVGAAELRVGPIATVGLRHMGRTEIRADEIDGRFIPRRRADISSVELDGELVLAAPPSGDQDGLDAHLFNAMATIIWKCFDGSASLDELIDDLSTVFRARRAVVSDDVLEFARTLARAGLLE